MRKTLCDNIQVMKEVYADYRTVANLVSKHHKSSFSYALRKCRDEMYQAIKLEIGQRCMEMFEEEYDTHDDGYTSTSSTTFDVEYRYDNWGETITITSDY